ncbi:MAG: hypothetical protein BGO70_12975 [Bacteroidetes bacterium 43-93]|nr:hypothetical protein [Bacteroidota bacterium]OJW99352.1 MAG: hypothetical protein BGO70_12975 [Bacteroidetes bacterium 43-93]
MRYLLLSLSLVLCSPSYGKDPVGHRGNIPYMDVTLSGGNMLPSLRSRDANKGPFSYSNASFYEVGVDMMINSRHWHVFPSLGARIGANGFDAVSPTASDAAGGIYGRFCVGLNVLSHPDGKWSFAGGADLGGGFGADAGSLLSPYYSIDARAGVRMKRRYAFYLKGSYRPMDGYYFDTRYGKTLSNATFDVWSIGAELRVSFGKYR